MTKLFSGIFCYLLIFNKNKHFFKYFQFIKDIQIHNKKVLHAFFRIIYNGVYAVIGIYLYYVTSTN